MSPIFEQTEKARRWMLVDDSEDLLFLLRELLAQFGIESEPFHSPSAALAAFAGAPAKFELVITDLEMPGTNGVEVCRQMLALAPGTKILLATGSGSINEESAAREGFCGLLRKPFPLAELRRAFGAVGIEHLSENPAACLTAA